MPQVRHEVAMMTEPAGNWSLARPNGKTVVFSQAHRSADLAELVSNSAVKRQGGQLSSIVLESASVRNVAALQELRKTHGADEAVIIVPSAQAAQFGVTGVDPFLYEGVAVSVTDDSLSARPVTPELPVLFADNYAPYFLSNLLRGELRPSDHARFAKLRVSDEFKAAATKLVKALAPNDSEKVTKDISEDKLQLSRLAALLAGMMSDRTPRYEAKRQMCRVILRAFDN